jgi:hypothetical protein
MIQETIQSTDEISKRQDDMEESVGLALDALEKTNDAIESIVEMIHSVQEQNNQMQRQINILSVQPLPRPSRALPWLITPALALAFAAGVLVGGWLL